METEKVKFDALLLLGIKDKQMCQHTKEVYALCVQGILMNIVTCSENYKGESWAMKRTSNGAIFAYPESEGDHKVKIDSNFYEGTLTSEELGIVCSLFAINHLSFMTGNPEFRTILVDQFHKLKDYVLTLKNAAEIYRAID